MRITLVIGSLQGGGAERVCVNLANAWANQGRQVTILTLSQRSRPPAYAIDPCVERRDIGRPRVPRSVELNRDKIAPIVHGLSRVGCLSLIKEMSLIAMLRHG